MLHPDDRHLLGAGSVDERADVGDHLIAVVGIGYDVVLYVDDHEGGVGTVAKIGHTTNNA